MKLLIIGGTGFLGRHLTALALDQPRGDLVQSRPTPAPGLARAHPAAGDRDQELTPLHRYQGSWDLAIDTCCYRPEQAASLSAALLGRCERLIFISTISVYRDFAQPGQDESAPLHEIAEGEMPEDYGPSRCCARPRIGPVGASGSAFCARCLVRPP